jgi:SAM-dependent methyltransferase
MDTELIKQRKNELVARYGPWTAANVHLGDDVYTIDPKTPRGHGRMVQFLQVIADITRRPFSDLRILDLGCLEGEYSIEFARLGAQVVGIEGRKPNIEKALFAKEVLGLENLRFIQDDVRNLSKDKYGSFDVILCSGLFYHLDAADLVGFAEKMAQVCLTCTIIDTYFSHSRKESFVHAGKTYWGKSFIEHHADATTDEREKSLHASLDNRQSFWPTRPSLYNLLAHAGFTSVYECMNPPPPGIQPDRTTFVAIKGRNTREIAPHLELAAQTWPEKHPAVLPYYARWLARDLVMRLPKPVVSLAKKIFRS